MKVKVPVEDVFPEDRCSELRNSIIPITEVEVTVPMELENYIKSLQETGGVTRVKVDISSIDPELDEQFRKECSRTEKVVVPLGRLAEVYAIFHYVWADLRELQAIVCSYCAEDIAMHDETSEGCHWHVNGERCQAEQYRNVSDVLDDLRDQHFNAFNPEQVQRMNAVVKGRAYVGWLQDKAGWLGP